MKFLFQSSAFSYQQWIGKVINKTYSIEGFYSYNCNIQDLLFLLLELFLPEQSKPIDKHIKLSACFQCRGPKSCYCYHLLSLLRTTVIWWQIIGLHLAIVLEGAWQLCSRSLYTNHFRWGSPTPYDKWTLTPISYHGTLRHISAP